MRERRTDIHRNTTVTMTSEADDHIATIRGLSHVAGFPRCVSQSDAVVFAVEYLAKAVMEAINGKSKKRS